MLRAMTCHDDEAALVAERLAVVHFDLLGSIAGFEVIISSWFVCADSHKLLSTV
jgi:hypothetical protein